MPDHSKILILSIAHPRRRAGAKAAATYTDFCPRPRFVRFLAFLLRLLGYKFATVSDALAAPYGKFVCLTFDGATRDIHRTLFPQLRQLRVPATVFVPTKAVDRHAAAVGPDDEKRARGLTWAHLRQLSKAGWEIGSLAHEPVDLTERSSVEQRHLIAKSRTLLTTHLGRAPLVFAYPFGAYDATTVSCLREEGFVAAVTTRHGINQGAHDHLQLRRLPITSSVWRDLVLVLKHALAPAPQPTRTTEFNGGTLAPAAGAAYSKRGS